MLTALDLALVVGPLLNAARDPLGGSRVGTRVGVEWEFSSTLPATHWVGVEWEQVATDLLNTRLPLTHSPTPNPEVKEFNRGGEKNCKDIWRNHFRINSPTPSCFGISTVLLLKTSDQAKLFFSLRRAQNAIEIIRRDFFI